jgi:hypothetical protein
MKLIELTQGRVAIVDDEDFEWLSKWTWSFLKGPKTGYAVRVIQRQGKQKMLLMHREISKIGKQRVDHRNGCGCDNRKVNLRAATAQQNGGNMKKRDSNTSGITGVSWVAKRGWYAHIRVNYKTLALGYFAKKKDAIAARRQAEIEHFGEYRHDPKQLCPLWKTGQCPDCTKRAKELGLKPELEN